MINRWERVLLTLVFSLLVSCSTSSHRRHPASEDGPPRANVTPLWVYSWTNSKITQSDVQAYLANTFARAQDCIKKVSQSESIVRGCEENLFAGSGLYVCDNPFTSHDYGHFAIAIPVNPADPNGMIVDSTSRDFVDGLSGVDRSVHGNSKYSAIVYPFRTSDFGNYAMVIRSPAGFDIEKAKAISRVPSEFKPFESHRPASCGSNAAFDEIFSKWGDHMEFLSITFNEFMSDSENRGYVSSDGEKLTPAGAAAVVASDAVARAPEELSRIFTQIMGKSPALKDSLRDISCMQTESIGPASCLARRIYQSLMNQEGSERYPTFVFSFEDLKAVLADLGLLGASSSQARKLPDLLAALTSEINSSNNRRARALEAYGCMSAIREQVKKSNFGMWVTSGG